MNLKKSPLIYVGLPLCGRQYRDGCFLSEGKKVTALGAISSYSMSVGPGKRVLEELKSRHVALLGKPRPAHSKGRIERKRRGL